MYFWCPNMRNKKIAFRKKKRWVWTKKKKYNTHFPLFFFTLTFSQMHCLHDLHCKKSFRRQESSRMSKPLHILHIYPISKQCASLFRVVQMFSEKCIYILPRHHGIPVTCVCSCRIIRKPVFVVGADVSWKVRTSKTRSSFASAQSDQSLWMAIYG